MLEKYKGLEQHHVKYIERDGVDEIILVTHEEHTFQKKRGDYN